MQRLRSLRSVGVPKLLPQLKKKALNSFSAVHDTYNSTKDIFERHKVAFTISTSIASVATAWIGYSIRVLHQSKVETKLEQIEKNLKNNYDLERGELKKIVNSTTMSCFATAATTLIIGYGFGWRGGKWSANRKFRKEQMKLLAPMKPTRWQLLRQIRPKGLPFQFIRRSLTRSKATGNSLVATEKTICRAKQSS